MVKDLDPAIERVILRCLEPEPSSRPSSALSVAAAMPGGDPLAAALAAGETPSPQMVAAAGETAGLKPRVAIICFAALLVGLAIATYLSVRNSALEQLNLEQTPEVLTQKVREMIAHLGYEGRPADSKSDFDYDTDFVNYVEKNDKPRPNWSQVLAAQPPILHFRYRQSPRRMVGSNFHDMLLTPGVVSMTDPPTTLSGMINVKTDPRGHLLYLQAIPPEKDTEPATTKAVDWNPLFARPGLILRNFSRAADLELARQFRRARRLDWCLARQCTAAADRGRRVPCQARILRAHRRLDGSATHEARRADRQQEGQSDTWPDYADFHDVLCRASGARELSPRP